MNWTLVVLLSLFGAAMAVLTVFVIPSNVEPACWLAIFVVCAVLIARHGALPFWHGVAVGLLNSVWITTAHIVFFQSYIANHAAEAAMSASMPFSTHPRLLMAGTGPVVGLISGIILGLFAWVASKFIRPAPISRPVG